MKKIIQLVDGLDIDHELNKLKETLSQANIIKGDYVRRDGILIIEWVEDSK